jgi:hypothetical protein
MEERRTAELMSDFDDYEIADAHDGAAAESGDADEEEEPPAHTVKGARKKKKSR